MGERERETSRVLRASCTGLGKPASATDRERERKGAIPERERGSYTRERERGREGAIPERERERELYH